MKTLQNFLFVVVVLLASMPLVYASEKAALDAAYCPALADEKSYEKNGLDNYKAIIRGKDDWLFRSAVAFKSDFAVNAKTTALLKKLQDDLKAKGTDLVIALPPAAGAAVNSEFLSAESIAKYKFDPVAAKKSYVDAVAAMKAAGLNVAGVTDYPVGKAFFYKRDHHWNPDGAKATAQSVAAFIKTLPSYADLPKTEFLTKKAGNEDYKGAYVRAFMRICKKRPPAEKIAKYKTEQAAQKAGADDLFGDAGGVPIVLVGTSNSAPDNDVSNFAGFLKEAASLDVQNLAIAGAGVDSALLGYLQSDDYKKNPAKILVWEVPGYYDLNKVVGPVLQQAIPAVQGDCGAKALAQASVKLSDKETQILTDLASKNIANEKQYIHLQFSKTPKKPFVVEYWSGNRRSVAKLDRSPKYPALKDAFIQVIEDGNSRGVVERVVLKTKESMQGETVTVRICQLN